MSEQEPTENSSGKGRYRLGLALSGGGFRASFFHIGVLARLAELDLLRHVQVISTVSGGSIIGALYYLYIRNLLQSKADTDIVAKDYIDLVMDLERHFAAGVSKNMRTRTFGNVCKNWQMYGKRYSRSDRIAELYTRFLYAPVVEKSLSSSVPFPKLKILPLGEPPGFHPFSADDKGRTSNDRRANKVPVLIINTTTLNTGHNFQFTASWLGEPPSQRARADLDKNIRLRRAYYEGDGLAKKYERLPLGIAVAASAAVPGIFHPLALTDLFKEMTPQLVDGGVHDNQGIEGLLDSDCTHLIVSDASGQMGDLAEANTKAWSVVKRSNDVLMDRVREEEYEGLALRRSTGEIAEFTFLHLKQDLQQQELTWIGGKDKAGQQGRPSGKTSYGVDQEAQRLLADIRTDLDSFSEVESHALMADGYLMAEKLIDASRLLPSALAASSVVKADWNFLDISDYLASPQRDPYFRKQLEVAGSLVFKVWQLVPGLKWSGVASVVFSLILLLRFLLAHAGEPVPFIASLFEEVSTYGALAITLLMLSVYGLLYLLPPYLQWVASLQSLPRRLALRILTATLGWLFVWIHLLVFDELFLWQGKVARLKK